MVLAVMCLHGVALLIAPGKSLGSWWAENCFLRHIGCEQMVWPVICVEYKDQSYNLSSGNYWSSVDKTEQSLHFLSSQPEKQKFGAVCILPLIERIRVIQLRSDHAWVIVTTAYLERKDDSCSAGSDKKPSLRLITNIPRA